MARELAMNELEQRKLALVLESETYRQTLIFEVQNLRLCAMHMRHRIAWFRAYVPLVKFGAPMLLPLLRMGLFRKREASLPRKSSRFRWVTAALAGWRIYRRVGPILASLLMMIQARRKAAQYQDLHYAEQEQFSPTERY